MHGQGRKEKVPSAGSTIEENVHETLPQLFALHLLIHQRTGAWAMGKRWEELTEH